MSWFCSLPRVLVYGVGRKGGGVSCIQRILLVWMVDMDARPRLDKASGAASPFVPSSSSQDGAICVETGGGPSGFGHFNVTVFPSQNLNKAFSRPSTSHGTNLVRLCDCGTSRVLAGMHADMPKIVVLVRGHSRFGYEQGLPGSRRNW